MIIDLNVKIIHLVKADPETTIIAFSQKNPVAGQYLGLGHAVHKIEIPYIHKAVLCVVVPVSRNNIQIIYRYSKKTGIRLEFNK
jgi:hypothetical protein